MTSQTRSDLAVSRHQKLREYLAGRVAATTGELAEHLGTSPVTIRRDLHMLEQLGVVERIHGGARLSAARPEVEEKFSVREHRNPAAKSRIGACVASLIQPGESITMNDGTTVMQVAQSLVELGTPCAATTNALNVALAMSDGDRIDVTVLGGLLRRASFGTYSPADDATSAINFDTAIIGVEAMDIDGGVYLDHQFDLAVARRMMSRSARVIIVADQTKWRRGRIHLAGWEDIDALVTDVSPPEIGVALKEQNVALIVGPD
ncbi:DeoR family transcriptional regulator [soil metagenome]